MAGAPGFSIAASLAALASFSAGALIGAVLVRHATIWYPLAIALVTVTLGGVTSHIMGKPDPVWVRVPA